MSNATRPAKQIHATFRVTRSGALSKLATTWLPGTAEQAAAECARLQALNPGETWRSAEVESVPRGAHRAPGH